MVSTVILLMPFQSLMSSSSFLPSLILPSLILPSLILPFSRTDTFAILVFHWTYALDLSSLYIAELEESDEEKGKEREKKDTESEKQKLPPQSFYTVAT